MYRRGVLSHPVDTEPEEVPVPLTDSTPTPGSALGPCLEALVN